MFCGTDIIQRSIHVYFSCSDYIWEYPRMFYGIMLVPQNIVMDMNNVMHMTLKTIIYLQTNVHDHHFESLVTG